MTKTLSQRGKFSISEKKCFLGEAGDLIMPHGEKGQGGMLSSCEVINGWTASVHFPFS